MDRQKRRIDRMNSPVAGIDIGERESFSTYTQPDGDLREQFSFSMNPDGYARFSEKIPRKRELHSNPPDLPMLFSTRWRMGYDDITVAHPKELSWIVKSKKKNDRVDSLRPAKLHLVGMLPESHLLEQGERIKRDLLLQGMKLGRSMSSTKNSIIGFFKREGLFDGLPETNDNFSVKKRKAMKEIEFGNQKDLVLRTRIERLEFYGKQVGLLETRSGRLQGIPKT